MRICKILLDCHCVNHQRTAVASCESGRLVYSKYSASGGGCSGGAVLQ